MPLRFSHRSGGLWALLLVAFGGAWGCASEEIPNYGDPPSIGDGAGGGTTTTSGTTSTMCEVDPTCAVSFATDIFPVLDDPGGCATANCHLDGAGGITLEATAASYYDVLTTLSIDSGDYIVPCDPGSSQILCNLKVSDAMDNPNGDCGVTMPLVAKNGPSVAQLTTIEDWIACGAPNN